MNVEDLAITEGNEFMEFLFLNSSLFVFMLMFLISTDRDIHEMHTHMHMNSYVGGTFLLNNCSLVSRPPEAAFHISFSTYCKQQ